VSQAAFKSKEKSIKKSLKMLAPELVNFVIKQLRDLRKRNPLLELGALDLRGRGVQSIGLLIMIDLEKTFQESVPFKVVCFRFPIGSVCVNVDEGDPKASFF